MFEKKYSIRKLIVEEKQKRVDVVLHDAFSATFLLELLVVFFFGGGGGGIYEESEFADKLKLPICSHKETQTTEQVSHFHFR